LRNQLAYLLGVEVDDDSNADAEFEPSVPSNHPSDESDAELSSNYVSINMVEEAYNDVLDNQDAEQHHRVAFYRMYLPLYQKVKSGTHLIDDVKY
jgi:hypothetical protein